MKKLSTLKTVGFGFIGGLLAVTVILGIQKTEKAETKKLSANELIDGNRQQTAIRQVNYTGASSVDFKEASKNSINSVVHVTTKVVQTTFQRDIFQEFFYCHKPYLLCGVPRFYFPGAPC